MQVDDFKEISGINFEKLPSGSFRVRIGKKITGDKTIRKIGDETTVCRHAKEYVDAWRRNRDSSLFITDTQKMDAMEAFRILREEQVDLTLVEAVRAFCARLPENKKVTVKDACAAYIKLIEKKNRKEKYVKTLKTYFGEVCHLYGEKKIYEMTPDEIEEWLDVQCLGKAPKTYNAALHTLRMT